MWAETVWIQGPLSTCQLALLPLYMMARALENPDTLQLIVTM